MAVEHEDEQVAAMAPQSYRAFLVRCWLEQGAGNGKPAWRFTLVQLDNGQCQHGFAGLDDVVTYLRKELESGR